MRKFWMILVAAICGAAFAEEESDELLQQEDSYNRWHFRIGAVAAPRMRVKVHGPPLNYPTVAPSSAFGWKSALNPTYNPDAPGATESDWKERQYADGRVGTFDGTFIPPEDDGEAYGSTWNWDGSFDSVAGGGNYNANAGTMDFRTSVTRYSEEITTREYLKGSDSDKDRDITLGLEAMGGFTAWNNGVFCVDFEMGGRYYGSDSTHAVEEYRVSSTVDRHYYRNVDSYDASDIADAIAAGQLSGSYSGSEAGPGPVIGASGTRSEEEVTGLSDAEKAEIVGSSYWDNDGWQSDGTHRYSSFSRTRLDYRIWDLRMGPTFGWMPCEWLTLRGGAYALLGLADVSLSSTVINSYESKSAKKSAIDPMFGIAAGVSAQVNLTDNLFIMAAIEYDWWTDTVHVSAGESDASLDLSDFSFSLSVGIEF